MTARRMVTLLLLLCTAGFLHTVRTDEPPDNFGVVVEKGIYRGAQPSREQVAYLHHIGVKTILKLDDRHVDDERDAAARAGLRFVSIPFSARTIGNPETCATVSSALAVLEDRSNWPVYVHCSKGRDRTGYIVGLYRERVQQWDWNKVSAELANYGHTGGMRRTFPQISRELERGTPACASTIERLRNVAH